MQITAWTRTLHRIEISLAILLGLAPIARASRSLPAPVTLALVCNVKDYGARGDGKSKDTAAIQAAIDHCPAGGIVLLPASGTYISGTIRLKSQITFRVEPGAKLKGSVDDADYPDLIPATQNSQLKNCRKALLYAEGVENITIDGTATGEFASTSQAGFSSYGVLDGSGANHPSWQGPEATRPMVIFVALSKNVTIRQLQVQDSGMWSIVNLENTDVLIDSVRVQSTWGKTRDGIDIVDCTHVLIQNCDVLSEDDSICIKSGSQKGVHDLVVRDSIVRNSLVANALKLGTASVGSFENLIFENIEIDSAKQAAMAVESVDGARIQGIHFKNIRFKNAGTAFFVLLGQRKGSPSIGSIEDVSFEGIRGETNLNWGSAITGSQIGDKTYSLRNIRFNDVQITSGNSGQLKTIPGPPPEYIGQYPDPRMWDPLPSFGLYLRHVDGWMGEGLKLETAVPDPRPSVKVDR